MLQGRGEPADGLPFGMQAEFACGLPALVFELLVEGKVQGYGVEVMKKVDILDVDIVGG